MQLGYVQHRHMKNAYNVGIAAIQHMHDDRRINESCRQFGYPKINDIALN